MRNNGIVINDLKFRHVKDIVRERIDQLSLPLASDIYVYPEYPTGWYAVFGILDPATLWAKVLVLRCVSGELKWSVHDLHGFNRHGALIVK